MDIPIFPEVAVFTYHRQDTTTIFEIRTIVRIKRSGKWHLVNVWESMMHDPLSGEFNISVLLGRFNLSVYKIILFHKVTEYDPVDPEQWEEWERLGIKNDQKLIE